MTQRLTDRYERARAELQRRGQDHVLHWWGELDDAGRARLLADIESIPWDVVDRLLQTHVLAKPAPIRPTNLEPAKVWPHRPGPELTERYEKARLLGRKLLREGRVAAFTVAGGQGTRLGIDGPKGVVKVTPVTGTSLFGLFAQMVLAARGKFGAAIPWYIMTSPANHEQTVAFFDEYGYFGLPKDEVRFFAQGMLPAFTLDGRLILQERGALALAPDGHGGSLKALVRSGSIEEMRRRGVEVISYFQVDNPLVMPFDPLFIGLHAQTGSEMSTKVTPKADDLEKVGNVCMQDGRVTVIEYSDFAEEFARAKTPDGRRTFDAGNLAIHLLDVGFVGRVAGADLRLPFRRAEKAVPYVNEQGKAVKPDRPNGVKLETFVFDVLPLAENALVLEVDRLEEFSPVKNATGVDSLETSQRDQVRRAARWLEAAGVPVPRRPDGEPDCTIEIAPTFALEGEDVKQRLEQVPALKPGQRVALQ